MKILNNQKGFGVIEGLLIVIALTLVVGVGYYVYDSNQNNEDENQQTYEQISEEPQKGDENEPKEYTITELSEQDTVKLVEPSDVNKLPEVTPDSFAEYMSKELSSNQPDKWGCRVSYSISKISDINIGGGVSAIGGDACGGGAAMFWYLKNNNWHKHGTQAAELCSDIAKTTIYSEFISECYASADDADLSPNPNGSIKSVR